jgi:hypothetical protein
MAYGRGAKATSAQRAEVVRLSGEGWSVRGIAREVFGDPRFRGRVERILRGKRVPSAAVPPVGELNLEELTSIEQIKLLFERRLALLMSGVVAPSMSELEKLLQVEQQLAAHAAWEEARGLTRRPS